MLNRRYSHQEAARVAAPFICLLGVVGGIVATRVIPGSPPTIVNAILWGLAGGFTGYLVFASEGPQQRPASIVQASIADGVVAGTLTALTGTLIDVIGASGAGSSSSGTLSLGRGVLSLGLAAACGALFGGAMGAVALSVGGRERFTRTPVKSAKKSRSRPGELRTKSGSKPGRKNTRR